MKYLYNALLILAVIINFVFGDEIANSQKELDSKNIENVKNLTQAEISEISNVIESGKETNVEFSNVSLNIGEIGLIMRDLVSYKVIVGSAEIIEIDGTKAIARISDFEQLKQPYLPTPRLKPQNGDKIIFRSLNDKAFLIAPNEEIYNSIKNQYPFITFINSDLLMGFLNSRGKHDPTEKTLPKACNEYAVGLVFIVGSREIGILSCQNVRSLYKQPIDIPNDIIPQSPFFTRVVFDGGGSLTYTFSSKKTKKDYFGYYDLLINTGKSK